MSQEDDVHALVDLWLQQKGLVLSLYLSVCSNVGTWIDGLFLWLSSFALRTHINVVHRDGIWTMHCMAIPDLQDLTMVFILGYYMATSGSPSTKSSKKLTHNWLEYQDSLPHMVPYPCVLNKPVVDLISSCDEIGLEPEGELLPLSDVLSQIAGEKYHDDLVTSIQMY